MSVATGKNDPRVQAIRCRQCTRLRPHPEPGKPESIWCLCGGRDYVLSYPMPGEEHWALQIYEKELKERELWKYS